MKLVFILVHGTFARKAEWIEPESGFSKRLIKQFVSDEVVTAPFPWSGCNTATARKTASDDLAEYVKVVAKNHHDAHLFIIGHSHGGTVAATTFALNRGLGIKGVICLATPFIHVRHHAMGTLSWSLVGIATLALAWLFAAVVDDSVRRSIAVAVGAPVVAMITSFVAGLLLEEVADEHARQLEMPHAQGLPLYIIRLAADEASGMLSVARLATWLTAKWRHLIENSLGLLAAMCGVLGLVGMIGVALISYAGWDYFARLNSSGHIPGLLSGFILIAMWGTVITSLICFVPFFGAMFLSTLAFGFDSWLAIGKADLSAEDTPEGEWVVHQLSAALVEGGDPFMRHSAILQDQRVPIRIAMWVRTLFPNNETIEGKLN